MVKVDADTMAKDIVSTGRAVLYGIYFDTGKDVDQAGVGADAGRDRQAPEAGSRPQASMWSVIPTTSAGSTATWTCRTGEPNAVVAHLRTRYGVEATRLKPVGVGFVAPVASNDSDDGRAKNRRVELVKQ